MKTNEEDWTVEDEDEKEQGEEEEEAAEEEEEESRLHNRSRKSEFLFSGTGWETDAGPMRGGDLYPPDSLNQRLVIAGVALNDHSLVASNLPVNLRQPRISIIRLEVRF